MTAAAGQARSSSAGAGARAAAASAAATPVAASAAARPVAAAVTRLVPRDARQPVLWRPLASYYLLVATSAVLIAFGLVMVWSASYVDGSTVSFQAIEKQLLWVGIGLPVMVVATRLPIGFFRALGYPALIGSGLLLVAVLIPGRGVTINGATRWLDLGGPFTIQPSEFAKLALVLWGADLLARKQRLHTFDRYRHILVPLVPVTMVVLALVVKEHDLGTSLVLMTIVLALLWVSGAPARLFGVSVALGAGLVSWLAVSNPYRLARLLTFLHPFKDLHAGGWQAGQGIYALGSGGWWGLGLGASREKWGYLPEAHSDFIFAIIGEELGLVGTLLVLGLFAVLAYAGIRVAQRSRDSFARLAAAAIVAWLLVQALVNIGAVIGLLPITGIPLPLISAGGSALLPTMFALGMLMSLARREPAAAAALAARGPHVVRRAWRRLCGRIRAMSSR